MAALPRRVRVWVEPDWRGPGWWVLCDTCRPVVARWAVVGWGDTKKLAEAQARDHRGRHRQGGR